MQVRAQEQEERSELYKLPRRCSTARVDGEELTSLAGPRGDYINSTRDMCVKVESAMAGRKE